MPQWLRTKTWVQFPAPTGQLTIIYNSASKGFHSLFWPLWALGSYVLNYVLNKHEEKTPTYIK